MKRFRMNVQGSINKSIRRQYVVGIIMLLCITMTPLQANSQFKDIPDQAWYEEHVSVLVGKGIISGYNDGDFHPYDQITVGQFIKTMVVAAGYTDIQNGTEYWASTYIDQARDIGLLDDIDFQTQASQKEPITRGQVAKICKKTIIALEGEGVYNFPSDQVQEIDDIADSKDIMIEIKDYGKVETSGYSNEIYDMYGLGVLKGYKDGTFKPSGNLSRAEAATVIHRVIDKTVRDPFVVKSAQMDDSEIYIRNLEDRGAYYYDINISMFVSDNIEAQYSEAEEYLNQLYDLETVKKVMDYVKLKKTTKYNLEGKFFIDKSGKEIYVQSASYNAMISIVCQTRYTVDDRE